MGCAIFFSYSLDAGSCLCYVITGELGGSNIYPSCDSLGAGMYYYYETVGMYYCHMAARVLECVIVMWWPVCGSLGAGVCYCFVTAECITVPECWSILLLCDSLSAGVCYCYVTA